MAFLKRWAGFPRRALLSYHLELAALAGLGLVVYGAALIWPPAAFLVAGAALLFYAVHGARRGL